jgi:hypothetical protein
MAMKQLAKHNHPRASMSLGWPRSAILLLAFGFLVADVTAAQDAVAPVPARELQVLVVLGAEGDAEYRPRFEQEVALWQKSCAEAGVDCKLIGSGEPSNLTTDADQLKSWLAQAAKDPTRPLWLVLTGHGTFDGREAKFNLRGPDINAADLAQWLKPFTGELAVIQTASASAPFLKALAGPGRVLISATKSADEVFYTRFGQFFAEAVAGAKEPDLDQDGQVSLLEAFLWSSKQVERFFQSEGRLATEHALLEDNGDGVGVRAEYFDSLRPVSPPAAGQKAEGLLARQWCLVLSPGDARLTEEARKQRDGLEQAVEALRAQKAALPPDDYYGRLEKLMLEIGRIYEAAGPAASD